jgi:hypothetical protein
MVAGAAVPIFSWAVLSGPLWPFVLLFGIPCAIFFIGVVLWPVYVTLQRKHWLTIWWAAFLGGLLAALPILLFFLPTAIKTVFDIGDPAGGSSTSVGGQLLIDRGRLTSAGWYQYFVVATWPFCLLGAIGGVVGWLVAAGFRLRVH